MRRGRGFSDAQIQRITGNVLKAGVIIASVVVFAGGLFYLTKYSRELPEYRMFSGEPTDLRQVHGIVGDAISGRSRGIIQFGLLLLMCTPVARVVFLLIAFAAQRDRTYVTITTIVLCALLFSLMGRYLYD